MNYRNLPDLTGERLAKAMLLHLTNDELNKHFADEEKKKWPWQRNRIATRNPRKLKLYLIRFRLREHPSAAIVSAENGYDALLGLAGHFGEWREHRHQNPYYRSDCPECVHIFNEDAKCLNRADVMFLGRPARELVNSLLFIG